MIVRVMTYNVRYFGHALPLRGATSTRKALIAIARAIATVDELPHLICLQEVETRSLRSRLSHTPGDVRETQLQALMRQLEQALVDAGRNERFSALHFPAHCYHIRGAKLYTTGLAILVRDDLQIETHNAEAPHDITHRRSEGRLDRRLKQSRICAHLAVKLPSGEIVDIFNTHLSLPRFVPLELFRGGKRMGYGENQYREVQRLVDFISSQRTSELFFLMGDFNSLPGSPVYQYLLESLPAHDPFQMHLGTSLGQLCAEWPTAGFFHMRMRLDHIFIGPGMAPLDFEDTQPFGQCGRWQGLSDHVPLIGRFELRPTRRI